MSDKREPCNGEMCMDIAPASVAVRVPPDEDGMLHTPWCHLKKGHDGPHQCGEHKWRADEEYKAMSDKREPCEKCNGTKRVVCPLYEPGVMGYCDANIKYPCPDNAEPVECGPCTVPCPDCAREPCELHDEDDVARGLDDNVRIMDCTVPASDGVGGDDYEACLLREIGYPHWEKYERRALKKALKWYRTSKAKRDHAELDAANERVAELELNYRVQRKTFERLEEDEAQARATIAHMTTVVEAAVAWWKAPWDYSPGSDFMVASNALCAAVEAWKKWKGK
jgi:hypothetical protein